MKEVEEKVKGKKEKSRRRRQLRRRKGWVSLGREHLGVGMEGREAKGEGNI